MGDPAGKRLVDGDDWQQDITSCRDPGIYPVWVDGKGGGLPAVDVKSNRIIGTIGELKDRV